MCLGPSVRQSGKNVILTAHFHSDLLRGDASIIGDDQNILFSAAGGERKTSHDKNGESSVHLFALMTLAFIASSFASIVVASAGMNLTVMPATCFSY